MYQQAKAKQARLYDAYREAASALDHYPRGPMNLTPDSVKATPEWQAAKRRLKEAEQQYKTFNSLFTKVFVKEIKAEHRKYGYGPKPSVASNPGDGEIADDDIASYASFYQEQFEPGEPGYGVAKKLSWAYVPDFPLSLVRIDNIQTMLDETNREPWTGIPKDWWQTVQGWSNSPVLRMRDGKAYVWDGNHRIALAVKAGRKTIPAVVGVEVEERAVRMNDRQLNPAPNSLVYFTSCVSADGDSINEMKDQATPISRSTFLKYVNRRGMQALEQDLGYSRSFPMSGDPYIGYYRSQYQGKPVLYFDHSAIEHVFMSPEDIQAMYDRCDREENPSNPTRPANRLTASPMKLAADYKFRGLGRTRAWSEFVKDRNLRPGIDAAEFYQYYDVAEPKQLLEYYEEPVQKSAPEPDPEFADYGRRVRVTTKIGRHVETMEGTLVRTLQGFGGTPVYEVDFGDGPSRLASNQVLEFLNPLTIEAPASGRGSLSRDIEKLAYTLGYSGGREDDHNGERQYSPAAAWPVIASQMPQLAKLTDADKQRAKLTYAEGYADGKRGDSQRLLGDADAVLGALERVRVSNQENPTNNPDSLIAHGWIPASSVVKGDIIRFEEAVFTGSFRKPRYAGEREIEARVLRESYGVDKQQHTFTLKVLASSGVSPISPGTVTIRKGRNIYRNGVWRKEWDNEAEREAVQQEKHERGGTARAARARRLSNPGSISDAILEDNLRRLTKEGTRETTIDVRDTTPERASRIEQTAVRLGYHVSGDGKYILIRPRPRMGVS